MHKQLAWHVTCAAASTPAAVETSTVLIDYGLEMQGGVNLTFVGAVAGQTVSL